MTSSPDLRKLFPFDGQLGPAARISRTRAEAMVEEALHRARTPLIAIEPRRPRHWGRFAFAAAVAIALPITVAAGAVNFFVVRHRAPAALLATKQASLSDSPPIASPQEPVASAPAVAIPPAAVPIPEAKPRAVTPVRRAVLASPEQLLEKANEARGKRLWLAATRLYEETFRSYPNRSEAYSAMVAAGLLRLDHLGDAEGALTILATAIRTHPHGALLEEAEWGVIESYRSLGQRAAEMRALKEFLLRHPESLLASRARARMGALDDGGS